MESGEAHFRLLPGMNSIDVGRRNSRFDDKALAARHDVDEGFAPPSQPVRW